MVVGTPNARYSVETANQLLKRFGDDAVSSVAESMLERAVFSKTVRDAKKPKPGRPLKISDQCVDLDRASFRYSSYILGTKRCSKGRCLGKPSEMHPLWRSSGSSRTRKRSSGGNGHC